MASFYLVFQNGRWERLSKLPTAPPKPPEEPEIKWLLAGWEEYCIDEKKRVWRRPHVNRQGRRKGWKRIQPCEKNKGYRGFNLWREGKQYYYSVIQLRHLLRRNPAYGVSDGS